MAVRLLARIRRQLGRDLPLASLFAGRVRLFRADGSHYDDPADPTLGWAAFAAGGVEVRQLPGNHWAVVRPPAVEAVAAALRLE